MYAFTPKFAMTYEWPVAKEIDYSDNDGYKRFKQGIGGGTLPPIGDQPGGGGGIPFNDLEDDGDVVGMGDLNLRFFLQIDQWWFRFMDDQKNFPFSLWGKTPCQPPPKMSLAVKPGFYRRV